MPPHCRLIQSDSPSMYFLFPFPSSFSLVFNSRKRRRGRKDASGGFQFGKKFFGQAAGLQRTFQFFLLAGQRDTFRAGADIRAASGQFAFGVVARGVLLPHNAQELSLLARFAAGHAGPYRNVARFGRQIRSSPFHAMIIKIHCEQAGKSAGNKATEEAREGGRRGEPKRNFRGRGCGTAQGRAA